MSDKKPPKNSNAESSTNDKLTGVADDPVATLLKKAGVRDLRSQTSRRVPKVSKAPPPPTRLPNSYVPPRDYEADYAYWNKFPIVSVTEAICLTIDIEPRAGRPKERHNRRRFSEIDELAQAHFSFGSLQRFPKGIGQVQVSEWLEWLSLVELSVPKAWQPIDLGKQSQGNEADGVFDKANNDIHTRRRDEVLGAAIEMLDSGVAPKDQQDVLNFMRRSPSKYTACFGRTVDDKTLLKSITRAGGNVLEDSRYLKALQSADGTD